MLCHTPSIDIVHACHRQVSIDKRKLWRPRPKMWVGQQQLQQVMALVADSPQWKSTAVWMLAAYVFKLRVPSECLPMVVGIGDSSTYGQAQTSQSIIHIGESEIVLCLKTRKNRCVPVTQAIMSAFMLLMHQALGGKTMQKLLVQGMWSDLSCAHARGCIELLGSWLTTFCWHYSFQGKSKPQGGASCHRCARS